MLLSISACGTFVQLSAEIDKFLAERSERQGSGNQLQIFDLLVGRVLISLSRPLPFCIHFNYFTNKFRRTVSVFINIAFEALICNIHLTETCKDFISAGVVVFGNVALQLFDKRLRFGRIRLRTALQQLRKITKDVFKSRVNTRKAFFRIILRFLAKLRICLRFAPAFFYFVFIFLNKPLKITIFLFNYTRV